MADIHPGSWNILGWQVPDLGISEGLSDISGGVRNAQGGSTWVNPTVQEFLPANFQSAEQIKAANQNKVSNTVTSQAPITTTSSNTGGGTPPVDYRFYQGWNDQNAIQGDWNATWQQKLGTQSSGGQDINSLISQMYDPALGALGQYEDWARGVNTSELGQAATSKTQAESALQQLVNRGLLGFDNQSGELGLQQRRAEAASQRDYRNALQQSQSKFGMGSSTGSALNEIILSEFLRNGGDLREGYASGFKAIQQAKRDFDTDVQLRADKIITDHKSTVDNINNDFKQRMADIAARRGEMEAAKTAARIDALQTAINAARQLEANIITRAQELQNFKIQYEAQINNSTSYLDNLVANVSAELKSRQLNGTTALTGSFLGNTGTQNIQPLFRQSANGYNDPYQQLLV